MARSWKIIAGCIALVVVVSAAAFAFKKLPAPSPITSGSAAVANSSVSTATSSQFTLNATTSQPIASSTAKTATTTAKKQSQTTSQPPAALSTTTVQARGLSATGGDLLKSIVNIVCVSQVSSIPSISGTGVIIDSRGIILTAAHVAQLFLLQDYLGTDKVQCLIRTGSPARRAYYAEPIYVSPSWLASNPSTLTTKLPTGNGQGDVALLGITGTATSTPLPNSFPALSLGPSHPSAHEQVAIGSYGAQYLSGSQINYALYPIIVFGSISDRYTYGSGSVDLFSIQGSAASQEGSSGGGVANASGQLIGTITTSSVEGSIQERTLNAISIGHVRDTFMADTGRNFDSTISANSVASLVSAFKSDSLELGKQLYSNVLNAK